MDGLPLVRISNLSIGYMAKGAPEPVRVVRDVDLAIARNEIVGLVGESGSGKTQTARAILRLNSRPLRPLSGQILLDDVDILALPEHRLRDVRGGKIAMIFQDPRSSLNPLMRIGDQLARVYALHQSIGRRAARIEAIEMLRRVGIAGPERVAQSYPHQLSGGMCQRVMISMGLGIRPELLIADEPTTGLDVTIQAQILELIKEMRATTGTSVLLITHDLGVVAETCQRVAVMYAGRLVEVAPVVDLFATPRHPYTIRLLTSTLDAERPNLQEPGAETRSAETRGAETRGASAPGITIASGGQTYEATLDMEETPGAQSTMIEVAPGHLVRCRPSEPRASSPRGAGLSAGSATLPGQGTRARTTPVSEDPL